MMTDYQTYARRDAARAAVADLVGWPDARVERLEIRPDSES